MTPLREYLAKNLSRFEYRALVSALKPAAVAILVTEDVKLPGGSLLLTGRVGKLRTHARQWALPGGRLDVGETALEACRREVQEELGLFLSEDTLLGRLDDYETRSGYVISPFVFWLADRDMGTIVANPDEISTVWPVSLAAFDRPENPDTFSIPESDRPVLRLHLEDRAVHAPTGAILYQFWQVAVCGRDIRVSHYDQPVWAWR